MIVVPRVTLANLADAHAIAAMSREYIEQGLGWSWTQARVLRAIRDPATNVAVVRDQAEVIAFGIMVYGEQNAHLSLLGVALGRRKRGLGALLLSWLEKSAMTAGLESVQLEARADNVGAIAFYRELGYVDAGTARGYYRGVLDAVRLEKILVERPGEMPTWSWRNR